MSLRFGSYLRLPSARRWWGLAVCLLGVGVLPAATPTRPASPRPSPAPTATSGVMLGIDVLAADGFGPIAGKKIALLTHAAGVNRNGVSTIAVLRRAPRTKLVALFAPEHGLDGNVSAATNYADSIHRSTGLPVYSLYSANRRPTKAQLRGIDALVIDLQDIGSRSYTFVSWMRYAMEACFENNVEVIVLDRPNPLGGLKVGGPPLDANLLSDVGAFRVPYVHGLTIGELALIAKRVPGVLAVPDNVRLRGKLSVIPMRGWTRAMRWPETGLRWVPTSPLIQNFDAVVGYAAFGLGWQNNRWSSGIGKDYAYRSIAYRGKSPADIIAAMNAYRIPGIRLGTLTGRSADGKPLTGVGVAVTDWASWNPTEFCFYMQLQATKWEKQNPYAGLTLSEENTFEKHVGSALWLNALKQDGRRANVPAFVQNWTQRANAYQQATKKYWLYR